MSLVINAMANTLNDKLVAKYKVAKLENDQDNLFVAFFATEADKQ